MIPVPSDASRLSSPQGKITSPWRQFLQQFTQQPPSALPITITGSPFSVQAREPGVIAIQAGTISAVELTRGDITINITGSKVIPVSINDTVTITYSVVPTAMYFLPNFSSRTG